MADRKKAVRRNAHFLVYVDGKGFIKDGMEFVANVGDALVFDTRLKAESYANGLKRFFATYNLTVLQTLVPKTK